MSLSKQCILEISELSYRAEQLARGSASDRKQADVILQRIGNLRIVGLSSNEIRGQYADALAESINGPKGEIEKRYRKAFNAYLSVGDEKELRDLLAGSQSITYTAGPQGGYTVPIVTEQEIFEALAQ